MKKDFENYLHEIGLSEAMFERIMRKYQILVTATDVEEFDDIFLSEGVSNLGAREYFTLFAFTDKLMCKISISKKDLSIVRIKNHVTLFTIDHRNFSLMNPTVGFPFLVHFKSRQFFSS